MFLLYVHIGGAAMFLNVFFSPDVLPLRQHQAIIFVKKCFLLREKDTASNQLYFMFLSCPLQTDNLYYALVFRESLQMTAKILFKKVNT